MTASTGSPAVTDYLARLDDAARILPPDLRAELVGQVREHLSDLLAELDADGGDEAAVRDALTRFGSPEQLVAAEAEQAGLVLLPAPGRSLPGSPVGAVQSPAGSSAWGGLELSAVLLVLLGGFVVPVLGPLVGLVLAWLSPRWTRGTKLGATLVFCSPVVLALVGVVALALLPSADGTGTDADSTWGTAYPVLPHPGGMFGIGLLEGGFLLLLALSFLGWLVAGLWLALAGRTPRRP